MYGLAYCRHQIGLEVRDVVGLGDMQDHARGSVVVFMDRSQSEITSLQVYVDGILSPTQGRRAASLSGSLASGLDVGALSLIVSSFVRERPYYQP